MRSFALQDDRIAVIKTDQSLHVTQGPLTKPQWRVLWSSAAQVRLAQDRIAVLSRWGSTNLRLLVREGAVDYPAPKFADQGFDGVLSLWTARAWAWW